MLGTVCAGAALVDMMLGEGPFHEPPAGEPPENDDEVANRRLWGYDPRKPSTTAGHRNTQRAFDLMSKGCLADYDEAACRWANDQGLDVDFELIALKRKGAEDRADRAADRHNAAAAESLAQLQAQRERDRRASAQRSQDWHASQMQGIQENFQRNMAMNQSIAQGSSRSEAPAHPKPAVRAPDSARPPPAKDPGENPSRSEERASNTTRRQEAPRSEVPEAPPSPRCGAGERMGRRGYCVPETCGSTSFRNPETDACEGCREMTACLRIKTEVHDGYGALCSKGNAYLMATIKNACDTTPIHCRVCPAGGSKGECVEWSLSPGQSMGGWATDLNWCGKGTRVNYWCTISEPTPARKCVGGYGP